MSVLSHDVIGAAIEVHKILGPGLLESAYEECLCHELTLRGIGFERQVGLPLVYKEIKLDCGYRADLIIAGRLVVEIKAVESLAPIHDAVMLTYLRLSGCSVGLIINFHAPALKDGIRRLVWNYQPSAEMI